jgi:hypothetical protein
MLPAVSTAATYKMFVPHWFTGIGHEVAVVVELGFALGLLVGLPVGLTAATAPPVTESLVGQVVVIGVTLPEDSGWFSEYSNS